MPITHQFDPSKKLLTITPAGSVSIGERAELFSALVSDVAIPSNSLILIDPSDLATAPTQEEYEPIASLIDVLRYRFAERVAVLCTTPGYLASCRFIVAATDRGTGRVRLFDNRLDADAWLFRPGTSLA